MNVAKIISSIPLWTPFSYCLSATLNPESSQQNKIKYTYDWIAFRTLSHFANPSKFITNNWRNPHIYTNYLSPRWSIYLERKKMQKASLCTMMTLHICKEIEPEYRVKNSRRGRRHEGGNVLMQILKRSINLQSENFIIKLSFLVKKSPKLSNRAANWELGRAKTTSLFFSLITGNIETLAQYDNVNLSMQVQIR